MGITLPRADDDTLPAQEPVPAARPFIFELGEVLSDTYEIRGFLGGGGMGQVFEAYDRALNRHVAVKAQFPDPDLPPLRKEGQAMAVFRHAGLVAVHGVGAHRGVDYLVMERVRGLTLADHLARRGREGQPFAVGEVLDVAVPLADTLEVVHRAGIVHRDIKPANVMIEAGKRIVLVDFGIFLPECDLTDAKIPTGTPQYMPPEAMRAMVARGSAHLVDLYAFGVLVFEMLIGRTPFSGATPAEILLELWRNPPARLTELRSDVPDALADIVSELMAPSPHERPQSIEDVSWRLRALQRGRDTSVKDDCFRVLIVDDEMNSRWALIAAVRKLLPNAEVATAPSAERALALVRRKSPDVILLDLGMPNMNGVELCMYLRGTHLADRSQIVVVSGRVEATELQVLQHLGVRHFVRKGAEMPRKLATVLRELDTARRRAR